jgi:hypothetical protein
LSSVAADETRALAEIAIGEQGFHLRAFVGGSMQRANRAQALRQATESVRPRLTPTVGAVEGSAAKGNHFSRPQITMGIGWFRPRIVSVRRSRLILLWQSVATPRPRRYKFGKSFSDVGPINERQL